MKTTVVSVPGTQRDAHGGTKPSRRNKWRPAVGLVQREKPPVRAKGSADGTDSPSMQLERLDLKFEKLIRSGKGSVPQAQGKQIQESNGLMLAMRSIFAALVILLGTVLPLGAASLPAQEWTMLRAIAAKYGLSDEETWLLAAIRIHENGRPGLEFGIGGPMDSGHRAHRYRDGVKSFRVQCAWAAGTIKRRYTGDLAAFGRRYNPPNAAKWSASVRQIVARLKRRHGGILP